MAKKNLRIYTLINLLFGHCVLSSKVREVFTSWGCFEGQFYWLHMAEKSQTLIFSTSQICTPNLIWTVTLVLSIHFPNSVWFLGRVSFMTDSLQSFSQVPFFARVNKITNLRLSTWGWLTSRNHSSVHYAWTHMPKAITPLWVQIPKVEGASLMWEGLMRCALLFPGLRLGPVPSRSLLSGQQKLLKCRVGP